MKLLPHSCVLMAVLASPVVAECFDATALTRGLTVRYENGDYTTIRRTGDGYQQIDEHYIEDGTVMRFRAHRGVYFVEEFEPDANGQPVEGTRLTVEFEVDPATLPQPAAGVEWTGTNTNIFDVGSPRPEVATVSFAAAPSINLTGCDYEVVRTNVQYDWGDEGWLRLEYAFLPAIGTTLLLKSQFEGEEAFAYAPVQLEAASK